MDRPRPEPVDDLPPPVEDAVADSLETEILQGRPTLTSNEVAERGGLDLEGARRLWRALGFPYYDDNNRAYVDLDLDAIRLVREAVDDGLFDFDTIVRLTRALGTTMGRLTDWQISTLLDHADGRAVTSRDPGGAAAMDLTAFAPAFERLLVYAWRRHLAAAVVRAESMHIVDSTETRADATVGFADLVSFTALSNGLDERSLGDLVEGFESHCTDLVTLGGGRAIKTLGDSVLYTAADPCVAVEIALTIVEQIGKDPDMPDMRVGLATGPILTRLGDVFGPPVNLAARLTTVARRNRVIVDHATADAVGDTYPTRVLPARPMHGFGNVEPVTVRRPWAYRGD